MWLVILASTAPARLAALNRLPIKTPLPLSVRLERFFVRHNLQWSAERFQIKTVQFKLSQIWSSAFAYVVLPFVQSWTAITDRVLRAAGSSHPRQTHLRNGVSSEHYARMATL